MDQLIKLMDAGKAPVDLPDGLGARELIEVKEPEIIITSNEDAVTQAVQVLNSLATLKLKVQDLRAEAVQVRAQIDILFNDESVSSDEIAQLKEGFKVLKAFAQANLRYQEARSQAEEARAVLDNALQSPRPQLRPDKPSK